uniref:Regulator of microtubule dynamics protein 1 n=1 Tax=Acrobeloides nanus TaxID=290746 RepID=A0A914C1P4_9BILA
MRSSFIRSAFYFNQTFRLAARSRLFNRIVRQAWTKYRKPLFVTGGTTYAGFWSALYGSGDQKGKSAQASQSIELQMADSHYKHNELEACYKILEKYESKSEDPEILWRLSRVLVDLGKNETEPTKRKHFLQKAIELADKALKNEGPFGSANAHKWYAIAIKTLGQIEGDRFKQTFAVKVHLERALELSPFDAKIWHELGRWHFEAADYPIYKKWFKAILFNPPPSSTYEEALRFFEKAEAAEPGIYHKANYFYMGETLERLGRKNQAVDCYKKAFIVPVETKEDQVIHQKVDEKLLKKYGINTLELPTGTEALLGIYQAKKEKK